MSQRKRSRLDETAVDPGRATSPPSCGISGLPRCGLPLDRADGRRIICPRTPSHLTINQQRGDFRGSQSQYHFIAGAGALGPPESGQAVLRASWEDHWLAVSDQTGDGFFGLSLTPCILLVLVASGLITKSINNWFNVSIERSLEDSLEVARNYYRLLEQDALHFGEQIRIPLLARDLFGATVRRHYSNSLRKSGESIS